MHFNFIIVPKNKWFLRDPLETFAAWGRDAFSNAFLYWVDVSLPARKYEKVNFFQGILVEMHKP